LIIWWLSCPRLYGRRGQLSSTPHRSITILTPPACPVMSTSRAPIGRLEVTTAPACQRISTSHQTRHDDGGSAPSGARRWSHRSAPTMPVARASIRALIDAMRSLCSCLLLTGATSCSAVDHDTGHGAITASLVIEAPRGWIPLEPHHGGQAPP